MFAVTAAVYEFVEALERAATDAFPPEWWSVELRPDTVSLVVRTAGQIAEHRWTRLQIARAVPILWPTMIEQAQRKMTTDLMRGVPSA